MYFLSSKLVSRTVRSTVLAWDASYIPARFDGSRDHAVVLKRKGISETGCPFRVIKLPRNVYCWFQLGRHRPTTSSPRIA